MDSNFEACFAETESFEGWHQGSNDPRDPGGRTYSGVTQAVYNTYRDQKHSPRQSVYAMSDDECRDIYKSQYWTSSRGADLPPGLDLVQYDEAVNSGPVEAARLLQKALGISCDGAFGLETLGAVKACNDIPGLIRKVCAARMGFWRSLRTWRYFGNGWTNRCNGVQAKALRMYAEAQKSMTEELK